MTHSRIQCLHSAQAAAGSAGEFARTTLDSRGTQQWNGDAQFDASERWSNFHFFAFPRKRRQSLRSVKIRVQNPPDPSASPSSPHADGRCRRRRPISSATASITRVVAAPRHRSALRGTAPLGNATRTSFAGTGMIEQLLLFAVERGVALLHSEGWLTRVTCTAVTLYSGQFVAPVGIFGRDHVRTRAGKMECCIHDAGLHTLTQECVQNGFAGTALDANPVAVLDAALPGIVRMYLQYILRMP